MISTVDNVVNQNNEPFFCQTQTTDNWQCSGFGHVKTRGGVKSITSGATSEARNTYHFKSTWVHLPPFHRVAQSLVFWIVLLASLSFFFWSFYCLSFSLRILITPSVSFLILVNRITTMALWYPDLQWKINWKCKYSFTD